MNWRMIFLMSRISSNFRAIRSLLDWWRSTRRKREWMDLLDGRKEELLGHRRRQAATGTFCRHILRHPEGPPGDPTNPAKPVLLMANKIDWGQRPTWMGKWKTYSVYPCYKTHSSSWTRWPSFKVPRTRTPEKMLPSVKDESMSFISIGYRDRA